MGAAELDETCLYFNCCAGQSAKRKDQGNPEPCHSLLFVLVKSIRSPQTQQARPGVLSLIDAYLS